MEEQQRTQQLLPEKNGRYPQAVLPIYPSLLQEQKTDEWDLQQFLAVVRRRAIVIGSVAIAICATATVWTFSRQAIYEGKFGLLVEPVTNGGDLAGLSQVPGGTNANSQREGLDYETQILVLKSPELMTPIIQQISTRYPDISYSSLVQNLRISRLEETKIIDVSYYDSNPQKIQFVLDQLAKGYVKYSLQQRQNSLGQGIKFVDFQLPQLRGRVNNLQFQMQRFREQYNLIDPEAKAFQLYQKVSSLEQQRLDVQKQLAETRKFYAALQGRSGTQLALQAGNSALNGSQQGQMDTAQPQSSALNGTLQGQMDAAQPQSSALNGTLQGQMDAAQPQSSALNGTLQSQLGTVQTQSSALNGTLQSQSGVAAIQNEGSIHQKLISQLRDLDSQIALDLTRYREDSPAIQALRQKRKSLLPVLHQEAARTLRNKQVEVANQISGLETRLAKIAQAENSFNQQIKQMPNLGRRYTDLLRELGIATQSLNRFLERRELLQVEAAQKEIPWQMMGAPQLPQAPISPNVRRNLILSAIAGILAGIGAALLVERLDNVFHSPDDLKDATKLPLLGMIPFHKQIKQLGVVNDLAIEQNSDGYRVMTRNVAGNIQKNYNNFPFSEAFRSLYTNIGFLGSDTPIHSLVVSSAVQGDGKSTVTSHLAEAAAAMGRRVLLVDADLRRPQIHKRWGLQNELGLSNVISTNLPVLDAIQRSPSGDDNFFVLTSGQIPPDPIKLLSSKKMQNIMHQLRQEFDLVIYDTPPLLGFTDSSLLATHTNGIVLVVRMGKTDLSSVKQALEGLKLSRATILGTVGNCVKKYNNAYNYYYQTPTLKTLDESA